MSSPSAHEAEMYLAILETLPDAIMIHDATTVLYVNPAAVKLLRADRADEVVGREYADFVHDDARAAGQGRQAVLWEAGSPIPPVPIKLVGADGETVYAEGRAWRIEFDGSAAILLVGRQARG